MAAEVRCAPLLTVLVLSDGQGAEAAASADAARTLTPSVRILERNPGPLRTLSEGAEVLELDWSDGERTASFLAQIAERWILVLAAGERLVVQDGAQALATLENLATAAVEIATQYGGEVRLHPAGPEALAAIGGCSGTRLDGVAVLPAATAQPDPAPPVSAPVDLPPDDAATEALRQRLANVEEARLTVLARGGRDVCWLEADDEDEPLVTIRIATYNRGPLIAERALASAVAQTYERLEILVVGDACDEATEAAVKSVGDPRVRFVNLPVRGTYPTDRMHRWMVAGAAPMNAALPLARGAWIAPCDDDDELTTDHVEVLLTEAKRRRLEWVYSKARCETELGRWTEIGSEPLQHGHISHGTVLYSLGLRHFQYNAACWKLNEPGDWNMWYRMRDAGVRMGFVDEVTYVHYLEAYKREAGAAESPARRLHVGCGPNRLPGWTNIDVDPAWNPDVIQDVSLGLPGEPGTADFVYSEHMIEHLTLEQGMALFGHCRQVLRPGGVVRIATPDLKAVVGSYLDDWRNQDWLADPAYSFIDSPAHMLNYGLRAWGHQYLYDEAELVLRLRQAGFRDVAVREWGQSPHAALCGLETRADSKLIVEAVV